jgi:uncharacterized protein YjbI with pentapeptide repeats
MANEKHVALLKSSIGLADENEWNEWRKQNPDIRPDLVEARLLEEDLSWADLHGADLRGANLKAARLSGADFSSADLREASLGDAYLSGATLTGADLSGADLSGSYLFGVNLSKALLRRASLEYANISRADFSGADLSEADLRITNAVETNFAQATLTSCRVYGISAWGVKLDGVINQQNLIITPDGEPKITVDNIEIAQFIYLLLYNKKIHAAIDTITRKGVLILGRFTPERKAEAIVPHIAVPVQPLLEGSSRPYAMFSDYWKYDWVLPEYRYEGLSPLLVALREKVIAPAEAKVNELEERRRRGRERKP